MTRRYATVAITLATLGVVGSVVLPLIPAWPFVLFEHFRFQYVWVGALVVAACAGLRLRGWFDAALIATLVNACHVLPDLSRSAGPLPLNGASLRVLVLNVHTESSAFADVARLVKNVKPDVLGLVEVDHRWIQGLALPSEDFPYRIEKPENDNFGIALYSRFEMLANVEYLGLLPSVLATVQVPGAPVSVVLTHPIPPVQSRSLAQQVEQLGAIAQRVRASELPVIVMGDFNATPWSHPFRDFIATSGLCDSRAGFGLQASFPAGSVLLGIPIDHVLISCRIGVRARTIERDVGSDHLPVLIDLVLPRL